MNSDAVTVHTVFVSVDAAVRCVNNRVIAWWLNTPFVHCETHFPALERTFSITATRAACWYDGRSYNDRRRRGVVVVEHSVSRAQAARLCAFYDVHIGCVFDRWWWFRHLVKLPPPSPPPSAQQPLPFTRRTRATCSQLVAEAYVYVGILTPQQFRNTPALATPLQVHDAVMSHDENV